MKVSPCKRKWDSWSSTDLRVALQQKLRCILHFETKGKHMLVTPKNNLKQHLPPAHKNEIQVSRIKTQVQPEEALTTSCKWIWLGKPCQSRLKECKFQPEVALTSYCYKTHAMPTKRQITLTTKSKTGTLCSTYMLMKICQNKYKFSKTKVTSTIASVVNIESKTAILGSTQCNRRTHELPLQQHLNHPVHRNSRSIYMRVTPKHSKCDSFTRPNLLINKESVR